MLDAWRPGSTLQVQEGNWPYEGWLPSRGTAPLKALLDFRCPESLPERPSERRSWHGQLGAEVDGRCSPDAIDHRQDLVGGHCQLNDHGAIVPG